MARTYSVSLPDAEARQIEIEAKKSGISVPELIRRKMKASSVANALSESITRAEYAMLMRELLLISATTRISLEEAKSPERDAKIRSLVKNGLHEFERLRKEEK